VQQGGSANAEMYRMRPWICNMAGDGMICIMWGIAQKSFGAMEEVASEVPRALSPCIETKE